MTLSALARLACQQAMGMPIHPDDAAEAACAMLAAGADSSSLRILAGLSGKSSTREETELYLRLACQELGIGWQSSIDAKTALALDYCSQVAQGKDDPDTLMNLFGLLFIDVHGNAVEPPPKFHELHDAFDRYGHRDPDSDDELAEALRDIRAACRRLTSPLDMA